MEATHSASALIDLNDAELFVQVVQAASFSAAAKVRGVPVSTVSRRIARLEARLGARLLERTTRKLRLTEVGQSYFGHAERAVDELAQGAQQVRELDVVPRGRVRLTAPVGLGTRLISALAPYMQRMPEVSIELDLGDRHVDLLADGIDIALRTGVIDSGDYVARQLFASTRHLYASQEYVARRGRPRTLADLRSHDLIATRSSTSGATWQLVGHGRGGTRSRHRVTFQPRLNVNELLAARAAAKAGIGIALLPHIEADDALVRVLPAYSGEKGALWLMYPARRPLTAAVRSCVDHLLVTFPATKLA